MGSGKVPKGGSATVFVLSFVRGRCDLGWDIMILNLSKKLLQGSHSGLGSSSVIERLLHICKTLCPIPNAVHRKPNQEDEQPFVQHGNPVRSAGALVCRT